MRRLLLFVLLALSASVQAVPPVMPAVPAPVGQPVFDSLNWIQNQLTAAETALARVNTATNNLFAVDQLRNLIKQLELAERKIEQMDRQFKALTGKNGYGRWLKGPAQLLDPSFRPKTRQEWINTFGSGDSHIGGDSLIGGDGNSLFGDGESNGGNGPAFKSAKDDGIQPPKAVYEQRDNIKIATQSASVTAGLSYAQVENMRNKILKLMGDMDEADSMNDKIAAQSAMIAELNMNMTVLIQLTAASLKLKAAEQKGVILREEMDAKFILY